MLTITDQALAAICALLAQDDVPQGAGLRISTDPHRRLRLTFTPRPDVGDSVVDRAGARVFLDAETALTLRDRTLDAEADRVGRVRFAVCPQSRGSRPFPNTEVHEC
ncbi:adhesin [Asanoa sp. NPDC049518]|uniref:adhesin n=1 Tax=unclassified Asanoa TaxID=2685164 RepID=UPI00342552D0